MKLRLIKLLEPITIREYDGSVALLQGAEPLRVSMIHFIASRLRDPVFGQTLESLEHCSAIGEALRTARLDEGEILLTEGAWRLLVQAVRTPSPRTHYEPVTGVSLLPFMRAIVSAPLSEQHEPKQEPQPAN